MGWSWKDETPASPVIRFSGQQASLEGSAGSEASLPSVPPLELTPWSIARLDGLTQEVLERPCQANLIAARSARYCLARFWLAAPVDALEGFFTGQIGAVYRRLLAGALPALPLDANETALRDQLAGCLEDGFEKHGSVNVLLALLPYLDRQAMQVRDPLTNLPSWLISLYVERCEPGLQVATPSAPPQLPPVMSWEPVLPDLAPITGAASMALIADPDFLGRLNGLINVYGLDPTAQDICRDLNLGRRQVAQVWLDVETEQLEALYKTPFGEMTDHLIASGFAREPLRENDHEMRQQLAAAAADLRHPRALNALMAVLLYYPIEQVTLPEDPTLIPPWLSESLRRHGARTPSTVEFTPQ